MRGSFGTVGGVTRTFGLHRQFDGPKGEEYLPRPTLGAIRRISRYFRPYWKQWVVILSCVGVASGLSVLPPFCVRWILDHALPEKDRIALAWLSLAMVGLAVGAGLIGVLQQTLTARAGQNVLFDLRNHLYRHLQQMSLHFYTTTRSGEIIGRINNDVNAVRGVVTGTIVSIVSNIAMLTSTTIALVSMSWRLALLAVMVVPMFYVPARIVGRIRYRLSAQSQEAQASLLTLMQERLHVGGAVLSKIFGRGETDAERFENVAAEVRDLNVKQTVVGRWLFMILSVFSAAGPAAVYWYGGILVMREDLTPGMLVAFAALLALLYRPLMQLASVYVDIQGSVAVFARVFEYLDLEPEVVDPAQPIPLADVQGHVVLEGVSFRYPTATGLSDDATAAAEDDHVPAKERAFALEDIRFEIRPGEQVALVGPSGAGKSTLTYLVPRFFDPAAGRITLDGHDLRHLSQEDLRRHIGMVTQETFLFHASIRENLLYARPEADEAEMIEACRAANIHEFIASLPEGYDTLVGERGFRLSGGEKQRVAIARALLKSPTLLILDEATSNLDATSEYLIQQALEKLLAGRTSLVIAHRLSTILRSDRIVVLERGHIVEQGRHAELLANGGLYATLFHQQFGDVLGGDGETDTP